MIKFTSNFGWVTVTEPKRKGVSIVTNSITLKAIALTLVCDPQLQLAPALEADSLLVKHNQLWHTLCSLFLRLVIECVDIDLGNAAVYRVSNTIE